MGVVLEAVGRGPVLALQTSRQDGKIGTAIRNTVGIILAEEERDRRR